MERPRGASAIAPSAVSASAGGLTAPTSWPIIFSSGYGESISRFSFIPGFDAQNAVGMVPCPIDTVLHRRICCASSADRQEAENNSDYKRGRHEMRSEEHTSNSSH